MKLTNDHFYKFQQSVIYWLKKLKLTQWNKEFCWQEKTAPASSNYNFGTKTLKFKLSKEWSIPLTDKNIDKVAKHEVLHCLLFILDNHYKSGSSIQLFRREQEKIVKLLTEVI